MTTRIPSPVAQWREPPAAAAVLERLYWTYDYGSGVWSLTTNPALERGRLADVDGTGTYQLTLLADLPPSAPVLSNARRDGATLVY